MTPKSRIRHDQKIGEQIDASRLRRTRRPGGPNDPHAVTVADCVARCHALRNRAPHMEPLLQVNATARFSDMIRPIGTIDPSLQGWFSEVSRVREVDRERPTT